MLYIIVTRRCDDWPRGEPGVLHDGGDEVSGKRRRQAPAFHHRHLPVKSGFSLLSADFSATWRTR